MTEFAPRQREIRIAAFPTGDACWRIDWFGEVAFPDRMIRRRQISVLVYLSRVTVDGFETEPSLLLSPSSTAPMTHQRKCWVSIGTLTLLQVGDVWRNQRPYFSPDYQIETLDVDVDVDDANAVHVKAGLSRDDGFLLPLEQHPWHLHNTHAYCVPLILRDGREVVVPCMELIRFYFGSSSRLLNSLFTIPLTKSQLFTDSIFDSATKHLQLTLADGMPAASAVDIARIRTSSRAWKAAEQVGLSCLQASTVGAPHGIHPKTSFPFEGSSTITASGKWLPRGDRQDATFVVFSLRQCHRPLSFRSLQYKVSKPSSPWRQIPPIEVDSSELQGKLKALEPKVTSLVERDAGNGFSAGKHRKFLNEQRFTDVVNKRIWGARTVETITDITGAPKNSKEPLTGSALGEPGSQQRIRPLELGNALLGEGRARPPEFLALVIVCLEKLRDCHVQLITASELDGWTIPMDMAPDKDGVIDSRLFISDLNGNPRPRKLAAFLIDGKERSFLLSVVETAPFEATISDASVLKRFPMEVTSLFRSRSKRLGSPAQAVMDYSKQSPLFDKWNGRFCDWLNDELKKSSP